jgi:uncharacterized membrane protein
MTTVSNPTDDSNHSATEEIQWQRDRSAIQMILTIVAAGSALAISFVLAFGGLGQQREYWGQFGDFMGGLLNPLISFFTLIVAIEVWKLQRIEMRETKKALSDQATTATQQRQEQRFFDLLNLYHRTVDSISATQTHTGYNFARNGTGNTSQHLLLSGKAALQQIYAHSTYGDIGRFLSDGWTPKPVRIEEKSVPSSTPPPELKNMRLQWHEASWKLDHYFRSIFRLLAESEALLGTDHYRYVKLLRAQLNRIELELLALNMWLDPEGEKMIPLAQKYGLLKHLPQGHLRTELEGKFPAEVFGRKFAE